jgi:hypothetical protein
MTVCLGDSEQTQYRKADVIERQQLADSTPVVMDMVRQLAVW